MKKGKILILAVITMTAAALISGCSLSTGNKETNTFKEPQSYEVSEEICRPIEYKGQIFVDSTKYNMTRRTYDVYSPISVQIDDVTGITLGRTTVGELVDMFDPKANILEEEKNGSDENEQKSEYSFKVQIGSSSEQVEYHRIRLIDSKQKSGVKLNMYKNGVPYIVFSCYGIYVDENSIVEEKDFVVTGVSAAKTDNMNYKDTDGTNKYAKLNCWISGGLRLTGEGLTYSSIQSFLKGLGLEEGSSINGDKNGYRMYASDDDDIFIEAKMFCSSVRKTVNTYYIPKTTIVYRINKDTQNCMSISVEMDEDFNTFSTEDYVAEFNSK